MPAVLDAYEQRASTTRFVLNAFPTLTSLSEIAFTLSRRSGSVPEPSSDALLLAGFATVGVIARRRRA